MLKRAVERNLEIIGEAINRIITRDKYSQKKLAMQSNYWIEKPSDSCLRQISDENIWSILTNHLPKLKNEVDVLIKENEK